MKTKKIPTVLNKAFSNTDLDDISQERELSQRFYDTLLVFVIEHPEFKYICGLNAFRGVPGTYVIALVGLNGFKVGYTSDLYSTILHELGTDNDDICKYAKIFINPNNSVVTDIQDIFPDDMIVKEIGGVDMNKTEIIEDLHQVDKKKVALAAGGVLALVGAITLIKFIVGKNHE